ncbi:5-methyltetrahydropteroyltriglutamate--homocysteine S-methyltransferase [Desulfuromonas acetoxidans]|uniref:5-methyltetrahydropteroyltriglutamate--homocysteine methyltransferase n=1 Tax=Desulfuromonas acetoxidans (strain DSM 684 / 11070) TaxID=281689 RepID=Q1JWT2_DESA6|nr:5-methyltetrahydropteroyltriglutamate--homocysteine S-methyltransferase [Desulfuromonas acetoxidans]EAT14712.1 5-methyltetrahydropteroyltriglutamate--homocysteine S-methyltransferase [Desulfuromonas acetoxidans DSM 684]MBF0646290.1 5-methyltetrahydropteroyltriglutamate--homocysteine S-methyltransferase [Desulfuromonas acetoxidans]NVD26230.1 5-methyltetrahydropteroyltriglutamate--homocysteine S-methyltransferase [Desulfuromonas acetoxidans]NVE17281.1 5-methyltetrahydropteroyltriglutamate--hom
MEAHVLGFPRIGRGRELKRALEAYWRGESSAEALLHCAETLREQNWRYQYDNGLSLVTVGDFSLYDQMLDTACMLGMVPPRFGTVNGDVDLTTYFHMARGDAQRNIPAMEMTKWFDTNYHYLVPEFSAQTNIQLASRKLLDETHQALALGLRPKPVLIGPITFLSLSKQEDGVNRWEFLPQILDVYCQMIQRLAPLCDWIQIDEPVLCTDLSLEGKAQATTTWQQLKKAAGSCQVLLATYFGRLDEAVPLIAASGCDAIHLDVLRNESHLTEIIQQLPTSMMVSAGIVEGRNVWKNDLRCSRERLDRLRNMIGDERLMIGSTSSLLHVPVDLFQEQQLDPAIKSWLAFAVQKCREVALLAHLLDDGDHEALLRGSDRIQNCRRSDSRVERPLVRQRAAQVCDAMHTRTAYALRRPQQAQWLHLPLLPTTTIGSFPQTRAIRLMRRRYQSGEVSEQVYRTFMQSEIHNAVSEQDVLGLDVLVHGEPERNDMVEYFGQQMDGFCFSEHGWVQSYGSRCVKPPIIYGDVSRPRPITVEWIRYAQSLTDKPIKGMVTGPVTMLCWSFVRDDLPRDVVCRQLALAVRDEVQDLEQAGIQLIQIDEAALREGMPLRKDEAETYLRWAVDCFRLTSAGVADTTQIHSHMCYSDFNTILPWIAAMDADVISIEASRSNMDLLEGFRRLEYPNEIGPGIYDIHSPRVPEVAELIDLIWRALEVVPKEKLWINPDCGLKTRQWPEVRAALRNMVSAAHQVRQRVEQDQQSCRTAD